MVNVAQLVRALDCGSKGRGFESHLSPPPFLGRGGLIFVTAFFYVSNSILRLGSTILRLGSTKYRYICIVVSVDL